MTADTDIAKRLLEFTTRFRALHAAPHPSLATRLRVFLPAFRALVPERGTRVLEQSQPLEARTLKLVLDKLRAPLERARDAGAFLNPWTAARLGRNEVRNAAALATLIDARLMGSIGRAFLVALLGNLKLQDQLPSPDELAGGYRVRREHCPSGEQGARIDLTIEGKSFVLGIEIKIDAVDQKDQLDRYITACRVWAGPGRRYAVVYLSPWPPTREGAQRIDVPHLEWRTVARAARSVLPHRPRDFNFGHQLLEAFAQHIQRSIS